MFRFVLANSFGSQQPNEPARKRYKMRKPNRLPHTHIRAGRKPDTAKFKEGQPWLTHSHTRHIKIRNQTCTEFMEGPPRLTHKHTRARKKQNSDQRGISGFCMFLLFPAYSFGPQQPNEKARKRHTMRKLNRLLHTHIRAGRKPDTAKFKKGQPWLTHLHTRHTKI